MLHETNPLQSLNRLFELKFFEQYGIKETYASKSMAHAKKLQNLYTKISPKTQVSWFDYFIIPFYQAEKLVQDRKSTRLNSSHVAISYAVFCLKKKNKK